MKDLLDAAANRERKVESISNWPNKLSDIAAYQPKLRTYDPALVLEVYNSAMRFAPTVMNDKLVLSDFMIQCCDFGGVGVGNVKLLCETEAAYKASVG
jgi:hypothetical protein